MEDHVSKDMNLWLDLLWELQVSHKATVVPKVVEPVAPVQSPSPSPSTRPMTAKAYTWSSHDLIELGEIEEMKVLTGGLSNLSDELDSLRRTVESHYVRLCSLESHLSSQTLASKQSVNTESTPSANGQNADSQSATASSSEQLLITSQRDQHNSNLVFNSLEELEARQRALRLQLTSQMQNIEKSFLKQQQASQQLKTLESRWENMLDKMTKRLQEIDTLRYGLLGSWRYSVSILCFIIFWPLIVRYFWITYGRKWARKFARRLVWNRKSVVKAIAPAAKPSSSAIISAATTAASTGTIGSQVVNSASSALSALSNAASNVASRTSHPVLQRLAPQNFWR